jgi:UDP-N-acetylglucosamine--dolichyl-phosphate N-acetylglucosaminephosphotransferase
MILTELNWDFSEIILLIIIFIIGIVFTYFIIPPIIKLMKKKNYIGYDIHKNSRPQVAESGGISIVIGYSVISILLILAFPLFSNEIFVLLISVILSGIIGFLDDRIKLKSRYKIFLVLFIGMIIFIANFFGFITIESPTIPFLGKLRLNIIYPLLAPLIVAVFGNTVNMLEGYNGEGSGTCLIALISLLICGLIWNSAEAILFTTIGIAVLIPFFYYNKYPAKIFPGDVGTLSMGTILAGVALFGSLEAAVFCALLIHVFNSFYVLYSVKGFFESSEIQEDMNDILLLEDDRIKASSNKEAALTLPRLILARGPLKEPDLVKNFFAISIICGFFAIFTTLMMAITVNKINIIFLGFLAPYLIIFSFILLIFFPRIRGIISIMIIVMIGGYLLLYFINLVIMPVHFANLILFGIVIPTNIIISLILVIPCLGLWYYISIRYFQKESRKM